MIQKNFTIGNKIENLKMVELTRKSEKRNIELIENTFI